MRLNVKAPVPPVFTHEGGKASPNTDSQELRRTLMTCLLWENTFYEKGNGIAERLADLVKKVKPEVAAAMAIEARSAMQLRHAPLFIMRELARVKGNGPLVAATLPHVIQRADEMGEFLALYWKDNSTQPISNGVKRGLAEAFRGFTAYQLAKYSSDSAAVKPRDVPGPSSPEGCGARVYLEEAGCE